MDHATKQAEDAAARHVDRKEARDRPCRPNAERVGSLPEIPTETDVLGLKAITAEVNNLIPGDTMLDLKSKMEQWLTDADAMKQSLKKDTKVDNADKQMDNALKEAHQNDFNEINAKSVLGWRHDRWLKEHASKAEKNKWANAKKRDQRAELRKAWVMDKWENRLRRW